MINPFRIIFFLHNRTALKSGSYNYMKKQILFFATIFISTFSFAQTKFSTIQKKASSLRPKTSFGVRAGLTSAGIRGDAVSNFDNLLNFTGGAVTTKNTSGFFAGGYAVIPVSAGVSLEPGVFYSEKGYELDGNLNVKGLGFLGADAKAALQLKYIDIPLLLKADLGGGLQVFAGPQFSYLSKANLHSTAGLLGINLLKNDMDVTSNFNQWDAAVTGGVGYRLSSGINVMASYEYGLSKIDANKSTNAYNQGFKVGIGIDL